MVAHAAPVLHEVGAETLTDALDVVVDEVLAALHQDLHEVTLVVAARLGGVVVDEVNLVEALEELLREALREFAHRGAELRRARRVLTRVDGAQILAPAAPREGALALVLEGLLGVEPHEAQAAVETRHADGVPIDDRGQVAAQGQ